MLQSVRYGNFAAVPRHSSIVAINDRRNAGPVCMAAGAGREPDRDKEPAVPQLNAVARARSEHFPVVLGTELLKRGGDLDRLAEGLSIVVAVHREAADILHAIKEMDATVARGKGDGIVHCLIVLACE